MMLGTVFHINHRGWNERNGLCVWLNFDVFCLVITYTSLKLKNYRCIHLRIVDCFLNIIVPKKHLRTLDCGIKVWLDNRTV